MAEQPVGIKSTVSRQTSLCRVTGLVMLLAAIVRLAAMTGDLAIDEVWSWWFVQNVIRGITDILRLKHDNNHILNTLIMSALGPNAAGGWYRLPAVIASISTVVLAGAIARRRQGETGALIAALLIGGSSILILYGSEARGYSYALCFAFLAWELLLRILNSGRRRDAAAFALAASLGMLSHLTFIYALAGYWSWMLLSWRRQPNWRWLAGLIPPTMVAGLLYVGFIRGMAIGGGPETSLLSAIISTLSISAGGPLTGDGALLAAGLFAGLLGIGLMKRFLTELPESAGLLVIIVLAPAAVLLLTGHALIYPRYFFIPIGFALLVVGDLLTAAWLRAGWRRIVAGMVIATFLVGNSWWTARLLNHGRGDYTGALQWMATQIPNRPATISSDHDFRNGLIYAYYGPKLNLYGERLRYVEQRALPPAGTDFLILHDFEGDDPFPNTVSDRYGNRFQLERTFRHQSLSGWNWWVYRRSNL